MSEKHLTESAWKSFAKGRGLKDAPLAKALAEAEKAQRGTPAARLAALEQIEREIGPLQRASKDRELADYLAEIGKQLNSARTAAQAAAKAAAKDAAKEAAAEDAPALLGSRTLAVLRTVLRGEPAHALVALAGKDCAVIVAPKPVSGGERRLLAERLGNASGIKYLEAGCILEQKAPTFVLPASMGGLAARLQAAIAAQTGQKLRVRVRGSDPKDVDEAADDAPAAPAERPPAAPATAPAKAPAGAPAELLAVFDRLMPQVRAAAADAARKAVLLPLVERFQRLARAGDAAGAKAVLAELVAALKAPAGPDARAAALADWQARRTPVVESLKRLENAIRAMRDPEGDAAIVLVRAIQANLSPAPATLQAVAELERYLDTDDIIAEAEAPNGFGIPIRIRAPLRPALAALRAALS